jgi:hypothetical protein
MKAKKYMDGGIGPNKKKRLLRLLKPQERLLEPQERLKLKNNSPIRGLHFHLPPPLKKKDEEH